MKTNLLGILFFALLTLTAVGLYSNAHQPQQLAAHYLQQSSFSVQGHRAVQQSNHSKEKQSLEPIYWHIARNENLIAIGLLSDFLLQNPDNPQAQLMLGTAYLQERQHQTALLYLQPVYANENSVFSADAAWFIALIRLHDGQLPLAKSLLQQVVQKRGNYHHLAAELLAQMG